VTAERWKRQEREVAKALGGVRLPNTGAGQCDVRAPGWAVQVKTRRTLPSWLWAAVDQAERDAGAGESPAVVLSEVTAGRKAKRLAVLNVDRFVALVAGGATTQNDPETGAGRAPPATSAATPTATMAMQQTRTPARTLDTGHRGDRPE